MPLLVSPGHTLTGAQWLLSKSLKDSIRRGSEPLDSRSGAYGNDGRVVTWLLLNPPVFDLTTASPQLHGDYFAASRQMVHLAASRDIPRRLSRIC